MKSITKLGLSTCLLSTTFSCWANGANDLFTPLPDSKIDEQSLRHYSPHQLVIGVENGQPKTRIVKGKVTRINYKLPASYLPEHAVNNYLDQLNKQGAKILFHCNLNECGNEKQIQKAVRPLDTTSDDNPSLVTAKISNQIREMYVSVYAARWAKAMNVQLDVVELIEEPLGLVEINQDFLQSEAKQIEHQSRLHKDKQGSSDHPMLQRLPGAYISKYSQLGFDKTPVIIDVSRGLKVQQLEGKVTSIGYEIPRTYSEYEVDANYKSAFEKLGFKLQTSCSGNECGPKSTFTKTLHAVVNIGNDENQKYRLYKLEREEGNIYGLVYVIGFSGALYSEVRIIEETSLIDDRVTIDLDGLNDEINQKGHAALDGLLFKFDSDEMLPESQPVLDVLTQYLKQNSNNKFYVVGHTDDKGSQDYNVKLSERRAKAVVDKLIKSSNVSTQQLTAKGLGEFSPVANNMNEEGQKQNRRVVLVLRSDNK